MKQYTVTGMSCAACSARVEKAVSEVPGVTSCAVSLLTNSMGVEGTAAPQEIIRAVENAGYGAAEKKRGGAETAGAAEAMPQEEMLKDRETPLLKKRLVASVGFLAVLMYFSMGHMMWGWPLPAFFEGNHVAMGLVQLLLTVVIMVINQKFFISGFKSLWHRAPNMDTLVALGATAAFGYSTYALFAMTDAQVRGDMDGVMRYMHEFYFESAAMILTLITVGKMLESRSKGKTTDALKSLMSLAPKTATIVRDGVEQEVPVAQVKKGDVFVVRPGENIPVDGIILEGSSAVNEAALTGDNERTAQAIGKEAGVDEVIAGVLPDGKEQVVRELQKKGKVVMVGDGINDAPALTRADIGMAIGAGTDIAIDAADVVLMKSRLSDVPAAIRLSRATLRNIHENLFWAFFYNIIGIPLAAGVWIPLFGWQLNPMFGAAAMSLSSFCVVTNALRLNLFRMYDAGKDRRIKNAVTGQTAAAAAKEPDDALEKKSETNQKKENETMKKTMKINGMMCGHCEARVKKALEAVEGVQEAVVSHESGNAVVTLTSDVADEVLKKAVEDQDYEVVSVES